MKKKKYPTAVYKGSGVLPDELTKQLIDVIPTIDDETKLNHIEMGKRIEDFAMNIIFKQFFERDVTSADRKNIYMINDWGDNTDKAPSRVYLQYKDVQFGYIIVGEQLMFKPEIKYHKFIKNKNYKFA